MKGLFMERTFNGDGKRKQSCFNIGLCRRIEHTQYVIRFLAVVFQQRILNYRPTSGTERRFYSKEIGAVIIGKRKQP
jgi:hypothetical protein